MNNIIAILLSLVIVALPLRAQDWTKESKDRAKRAALHDIAQLVRGDSGKWNDDAALLHAPPIAQKPGKISVDDWADQLRKKKPELTDKDDNWLIFRSAQLDDNDRVWIERIERRGKQITVVANQAKWQGKYFRNFTGYQVIAINLGKLETGKYEVKWIIQPLVFTKFEGDGKAIESNWPKDERLLDKKPAELRLAFIVNSSAQSTLKIPAADWPQFMRNAAHTGDAADETLRLPLGLAAQVRLDDAVLTSAAVVQGRAYVVDQMGTAYCIDVRAGAIVWKQAPDGAHAMGSNTSSPCVVGGRVCFGTTAGAFHILDTAWPQSGPHRV